ncbi:MAG: NAD(P)H-dependent glycerol-3-phosphate dehydrogenase [Rickettsiaceae bacterium]
MKTKQQFAIIGGGSWGTALACLVSRITGNTLLYTMESNIANEINSYNTNKKYLQNTPLCPQITATTKLEDTIHCPIIILATPSYAFESIIIKLQTLGLPNSTILLVATKGLCQNPVQLFSTKLEERLDNSYGFISGPNFAKEVAEGKFAAITITSKDLSLAQNLANQLSCDNLNTSISSDVITVQIASIVKNIIAIKSGILQAQGHGENAKAWLVSQGLQEIATIITALGGNIESLCLPAVIGDLVLTSYSTTSRNTKFGFDFYNNNYSQEFLTNYPILVEGLQAVPLIMALIKPYNLDVPIISSIFKLINSKIK